MKKFCQLLAKFFFGDEIRHVKFGRSALAIRAKPKRSPTTGNRLDGNHRPEDFGVKFAHGLELQFKRHHAGDFKICPNLE